MQQSDGPSGGYDGASGGYSAGNSIADHKKASRRRIRRMRRELSDATLRAWDEQLVAQLITAIDDIAATLQLTDDEPLLRGTHGHRITSSPPRSVFASQMSDRPRSPSTPSTSLSFRRLHMTSLGTGLDRAADTTTAHSLPDGRLGNHPDNRRRSTPSVWFTPTKSCRLFPTMAGTFSSQQ